MMRIHCDIRWLSLNSPQSMRSTVIATTKLAAYELENNSSPTVVRANCLISNLPDTIHVAVAGGIYHIIYSCGPMDGQSNSYFNNKISQTRAKQVGMRIHDCPVSRNVIESSNNF